MFPPLTRILAKIFVAGFYKVHAGLLLTLFVSIFINFFFTSVLNQTHLTNEELILNNLKLVLTSVSNPVAMAVLFIIWLFYTFKSCKYVSAQLVLAEHQFLFYSSSSFSRGKQFRTWFIVQCLISLPLIVLGVFAMIIGIIFRYYIIPLIIPAYLLLLISGNALYFTVSVNRLVNEEEKSYGLRLMKNWPKPLFSLFLYQILDKNKLTLVITKLISGIIITGVYLLFPDKLLDMRIPGMMILGVIVSHTVLIFQSNEFDRIYLRFACNFPYSRNRTYLHFALLYLLLLLPEFVWFFCVYSLAGSLKIILLGITSALLFRTLLFWLKRDMSQYIRMVFGLFIAGSLIIMFGLSSWLIVLNFALSLFLFGQFYNRSMEK